MKINIILILSFIVLIASSSCGRRNMGYDTSQQYYPQGMYYGNHFYDPMYYSFIPRGNRVIIIDDRTDQQVAAPRRAEVRESADQTVRRQPQRDSRERSGESNRTDNNRRAETTETRKRPADSQRPVETKRSKQAETQRQQQNQTRRREQTTPTDDTRRSSPNVNQTPTRRTETRTAPPATPQNRSTGGTTGGTRPSTRRGN